MKYIRNAWGHFKTITRHKFLVMQNCFRVGLIRQGILHDLSKYSWEEFRTGVLYYQGNRSPNSVERLERGTSPAWLHHKGRNKHHYEYWCDYNLENPKTLIGCRMPYRYVAEMFCDRVAASKIYKGKAYRDDCPWEYFQNTKDSPLIHPLTNQEITELLQMLKEKGEAETFSYLKREVQRRKREKEFF